MSSTVERATIPKTSPSATTRTCPAGSAAASAPAAATTPAAPASARPGPAAVRESGGAARGRTRLSRGRIAPPGMGPSRCAVIGVAKITGGPSRY
ncbi:hypothetical protein ACFQHO_44420 [Actinomadura yumaensis]|uniref:hypothetical protein n=1 Tax=Actinomadura yumaensis TaxID=111807 RepID=UPI003619F0DD